VYSLKALGTTTALEVIVAIGTEVDELFVGSEITNFGGHLSLEMVVVQACLFQGFEFPKSTGNFSRKVVGFQKEGFQAVQIPEIVWNRSREIVACKIHVLEAQERREEVGNRSLDLVALEFQDFEVGHESDLSGQRPLQMVFRQPKGLQILEMTHGRGNLSRQSILSEIEFRQPGDLLKNHRRDASPQIHVVQGEFFYKTSPNNSNNNRMEYICIKNIRRKRIISMR